MPGNNPHIAQAVAAAKALAPSLRERAQSVDQSRQLPEETLHAFREAGFYRMCVPARFGGWGLDIEAAIRVSFELAKACASSGWIAAQIGFEAIVMTIFPAQAQEEFWRHGPDVGAASANALLGSEFTRVPGGYRIRNATWKFASGVDHAEWLIVTQVARGGAPLVLVPRVEVEVFDDWFTMGLRGTGSKQVHIAEAFVPEHRTAAAADVRNHAFSMWILGAIAWGAALGANRDFERMMSTRRSSRDLSRPAERDSAQIALARSSVELDCCEMLFERDLALLREAGRNDRQLSPQESLLVARDCAYACEIAYRATQLLHDEFGSSVIYADNPIQRALRDIMAVTRHGRISWQLNAKNYGMWRLGNIPNLPLKADDVPAAASCE